MNILIIANHYAVASGRYITDAFKRLGHEVRHTGAAMKGNIWGLTLPEDCVWTPDTIEDGWEPELAIIADSDPSVWQFAWDTLKPRVGMRKSEAGPVKIIWGVDNHVRDYTRAYADHYFLAHRNVSQMRWEHVGGLITSTDSPIHDMTHLPCAYDPIYFTPSQIPYEDRAYDVCILGMFQGYPHRVEIVKRLKAAGIKVMWGTGLVYNAYAAAYQNSRISLCLSAAHDVGQRIFETAAMGCLVMSDPCPDFELLQPEGIIVLNDPNRIVEDVQTMLGQPEVAKAAIEKSLAWVKPHSWDDRAKVVLEWYQEKHGERTPTHTHS